ncbi:MAG: DNA gyrase subunit A, partial [Candidatus Spechtbacteria bacterium]|nr:DNA gyrase subunit A [Candidatus Spechtbacteria bacterium]
DREDAHKNLRKEFGFSGEQATAILEMRLQTLANLEQKAIEDELKEKRRVIRELTLLLSDAKVFRTFLKEEFSIIKKTYGDARRTRIEPLDAAELQEEDLIPKEETVISLTRGGYIKRVHPSAYKTQKRGGKGIIGMETKGEDVVQHFLAASTHDRLLFFTAYGKVYQTIAYEIPKSTRIGRGKALANFLDLERDDFVTAILSLERMGREQGREGPLNLASKFLIMQTKYGIVKKSPIEDFQNVRRSGLTAIHLKKGDTLEWVGVTHGKDEILLVTSAGQAIRFRESDVRPMGRTATGVRAIHLREQDRVISMVVLSSLLKHVLVVSENGFGKRTLVSLFKIQRRGGSGIKAAKCTDKTGKIVQARGIVQGQDELIVVSQKGQVIRTPLQNISTLGRATQGVKIMRLDAGDKVVSAVTV